MKRLHLFHLFFLGSTTKADQSQQQYLDMVPGSWGIRDGFFLGKDFGFFRDYISHGTYFFLGINRKLMQIYNNFDGFPENNDTAVHCLGW